MAIWHRRTAIVVGLLGISNACASAGREGPALQERVWPAYLGASSRAGRPETLSIDPQPVWRAAVARGISGAPALAEDVLALSLADNRVALLERATGAVIWMRRLGLPLGGGPLLNDDRLFVAEQNFGGKVYALRLNTGTTIWSTRAGDVTAPLALGDNALYAGTIEGAVLRLDPRSGTVAWRTRLAGAVRTAPIPSSAGIIVTTASDSVFLLDPAHGTIRARRATAGAVLAAPALADSVLVIGTSRGRLEALDASTLRSRWSHELGEPIVGSVAVQGNVAYAVTGRGTVAMAPLFGGAVRRLPLGLAVRAGPTPTAQGVYVSAVNGEIVLVDSAGTRRWTGRVEAPVWEPVVADARTLIAVSLRGDVVAFR